MTESVSVLAWIVIENTKIKGILRQTIIVPVAIKLTFECYENGLLTYGM
jgi:ribosomal protein S19